MRIILVYIPCPTPEAARSIAQTAIQEKLAACANIMAPMQSVYMWEGALQTTEETVCLLKTQAERFSALRQRVEELHPYEVPCILSIPVELGNTPFLQWVINETKN